MGVQEDHKRCKQVKRFIPYTLDRIVAAGKANLRDDTTLYDCQGVLSRIDTDVAHQPEYLLLRLAIIIDQNK